MRKRVRPFWWTSSTVHGVSIKIILSCTHTEHRHRRANMRKTIVFRDHVRQTVLAVPVCECVRPLVNGLEPFTHNGMMHVRREIPEKGQHTMFVFMWVCVLCAHNFDILLCACHAVESAFVWQCDRREIELTKRAAVKCMGKRCKLRLNLVKCIGTCRVCHTNEIVQNCANTTTQWSALLTVIYANT